MSLIQGARVRSTLKAYALGFVALAPGRTASLGARSTDGRRAAARHALRRSRCRRVARRLSSRDSGRAARLRRLSLFVHSAARPPRSDGTANIVGLVAYLFTCALIIVFGEAARIAESRAHERREVFRVTLRSIGDAVITTDTEGRITDLNEVAETLTGWSHNEALGQPLERVFNIINEVTRQPVENPAQPERCVKEWLSVLQTTRC